MMDRLKQVTRQLGLPLGERDKTYNSRLAQELAKWAESKDKGGEFHEPIFHAYFVDGKNIGKINELVLLAKSIGLSEKEPRRILGSRAFKDAVDSDWSRCHTLEITAVPAFVMGNQAVVGFQPYDVSEEFLKTNEVKRRACFARRSGVIRWFEYSSTFLYLAMNLSFPHEFRELFEASKEVRINCMRSCLEHSRWVYLRGFFLGALVIFCVLLIPSNARPTTDFSSPYGVTIYQFNEKSPNRLFIIGISHRDAVTFSNGSQTPRIQAEIYKIADGLIHHEGVDLLLPEGYFGETRFDDSPESAWRKTSQVTCEQFSDERTLETRLSDDRTFINAEMLLMESHPLRIRRVEEETLYSTARECLIDLITPGRTDIDAFFLRSRLDYLQERRTTAMLQNAPDIIQQEFEKKNIKNQKAILTIGASHIHEIVRYLEEGRIRVSAPFSKSTAEKDYVAELNLLRGNFGVFILLPKTLAQDRKILEVNQLENIVGRARRQPFELILPDRSPASK